MTRQRAALLKGSCVYFPTGPDGGILPGIIMGISDEAYAVVNSHVTVSDVGYGDLYETYAECKKAEDLKRRFMERTVFQFFR